VDPLTGGEIDTLLNDAYSAPKDIVVRAAKLAK
jgi:hypothetical protein